MSEDKVEVTFYIAMNEDGDYIVTHDEDQVVEIFDNEIGGLVREVTVVTVRKSKPKSTVLATVDLPEDGTEVTLTVDGVK